jgi:diacylglycerol kinase (ATP)
MRKAILLYNLLSGRRRHRRAADVDSALSILRGAGVEATASPTRSSSEASEQARQAVAAGYDTIFACGGDGTIHDVLQGIVGTSAALAVIPLGTANSLAHDLRIPQNPAVAARMALSATPRRIAVGRVQCLDFEGNNSVRHFIVAVGVGVDAHLFYKLNIALKQQLGMIAYYGKATHLWLTHRMEYFTAEFLETGANEPRRTTVSELLAVRIRNFGGILQELAPGASLNRDDMRLVLFSTTSRIRYLLYVIRGLLRQGWNVRGIDLVHGHKIVCQGLPASAAGKRNPRIYVEADGELVGTIPAQITVVPDALTLLVPSVMSRK